MSTWYFHIGGDEFSVILRNEDFDSREELTARIKKELSDISASAANSWEEVHLSMGIAVYDPGRDHTVNDVVRRADQIMYEEKRLKKMG